MRTIARLSVAGAALGLSVVLAACGGSSGDSGSMSGMDHGTASTMPTTSASTSDVMHNAADITFTQNMIVHHQGAIDMAKLAATRASSAQVKELATRIEAAQGPEITTMTGWLTAWGEPATTGDSTSGMDMGSDNSMGMMSPQQMKELKATTGRDFDRMFLQMMTIHHQGAIAMAKTEQADGSNPQAIELATSIQTSQTSEVDEMNQLLRNL